jgi:hypothetical protein
MPPHGWCSIEHPSGDPWFDEVRIDTMIQHQFQSRPDGSLVCDDGWAVRFMTADTLEYCEGDSSCLVNVGYVGPTRARRIYATESTSQLFPNLREHLEAAASFFRGQFEVV